MRFHLPRIPRQGRNSRLRFGAASGRSRRPIARLQVEVLESRRLLSIAFNEFPTPTANITLSGIAAGPDGNLWFTEGGAGANQIGEINPTTHVITEFPVPTADSQLSGIAAGPDGNLWFTENQANQIGQINPTTHVVTEFPIPTANSQPFGIAAGSDGNLWFTEIQANQIGEINPTTHVITEFPIPTADSAPFGIATGPDGNIWFTENGADKIGTINPTTHTFTEFPIPTADGGPLGIAAGPDGSVWFTELDANQIGAIDPTTHTITEFPIPTAFSNPNSIVAGPDGNLWFTETGAGQIGQINPTTHAITEFALPSASPRPIGIAAGSDGNIWFTDAPDGGPDTIGQVAGVPTPELALSGAAPGSATLGNNVTDTLTVTNNGTAAGTGVTLTDTLPSGMTFVSATGGVTPVNGVLTFALGSLAAGAGMTVTIVVKPTATGTLTNRATVSMNQLDPTAAHNQLTLMTTVTATPQSASGPQSVSAGVVGAPTIGLVQRYGYHMMPTTIVLTFDQALDAVTAEDAKDYRIIGPAGRTIAIKKAVYDAAPLTVTLYPVERISIHHRYELIVDGTAPHGLTNTRGQLLDGDDSGSPDSDYRAPLTWRNLVLDPPWPKTPHGPRSTTRSIESGYRAPSHTPDL
jgi:uncharacterized repeat protein (TIGR01451 family)